MVTTRGQKSFTVPVAAVEPKSKVKSKARKDVLASRIKPCEPESTPVVHSKKRHHSTLFSDDANTLTPRRSKRHAAVTSFHADSDEDHSSEPTLDESTLIGQSRSDLPTNEAQSDDPVTPKIEPDDLDNTETVLTDLPSNEALPSGSPTICPPLDDSTALEDSLSDQASFSRSEDEEQAVHSLFAEDHIPRPSIRSAIRSPDLEIGTEQSSFSTGAHRFLQEVILHTEDSDTYEKNLELLNAIQEQDKMIAETGLELKTEALPHLEGTAMIILYIIAKATPSQILAMAKNPQSQEYKEYDYAKTSFVKLRSLLSSTQAILNAHDMGLLLPEQETAIAKTNLATYISGVFGIPGKQDLSFHHLNEYFLATLVSNGKLTGEKQDLYLDLKTHAYISGLESGGVQDEMLEELFPADIQQQLLENGGGVEESTSRGLPFAERCKRRGRHLMKYPPTKKSLELLNEKYIWENYLVNLGSWLRKNFELLTGVAFETQAQTVHKMKVTLAYITPFETTETREAVIPNVVKSAENLQTQQMSNEDEIAEKAARAADLVMQDFGNQTPVAPQPYQQIQFQQPTQQNGYYIFDNANQGLNPQRHPHVGQEEASLQDQYQQARLTANTKTSPTSRRHGTPSSRRPWTRDEEKALMNGLDNVGPHWSQILALYGVDGTISKVLKDRNQVQLKDKARNLKLYFLKQGKPVPARLMQVTGELKTRAPTIASRQTANHLGMTPARTYQQPSPTAASSPVTEPGMAVPSPVPTSSRRLSGHGMTQRLTRIVDAGNAHNTTNADVENVYNRTIADTGNAHNRTIADSGNDHNPTLAPEPTFTGPEADLEAALAAAERAGLESSSP